MKTDIHPQYNEDVKVTCACGNSFTIGSTAQAIDVEVCSACHPFFTGDTSTKKAAGRVEKFKARAEAAKAKKAQMTPKKPKAAKKDTEEQDASDN